MRSLAEGFRFGMILQLAVGPVCLLVFQTAGSRGFFPTMLLVIGVALADLTYIVISALGIGTILGKKKEHFGFLFFSGLVLLVFGMEIILDLIGISILPSFYLFPISERLGLFLKGFLFTASNPLTILFWTGVFAGLNNQKKTIGFGSGCILSTMFFLSLVTLLGTLTNGFLSQFAQRILNLAAGMGILFFGMKKISEGIKTMIRERKTNN